MRIRSWKKMAGTKFKYSEEKHQREMGELTIKTNVVSKIATTFHCMGNVVCCM
jgi:hypothetical protein